MLTNNQTQLIRFSLAFLWVFTAITSVYLAPEIGLKILTDAGIIDHFANLLIYLASILDLTLGFWLLVNRYQKLCCIIQISTITTFTLILSFIDMSYWLDPFGPITKNIPIIVLILIYRSSFLKK